MTDRPKRPRLVVHGACHPMDRGNSAGRDHLVVGGPLKSGRLVREKGDPLCRPRHKFWGLGAEPERRPTCTRCLEMAARHGFGPSTWAVGDKLRHTWDDMVAECAALGGTHWIHVEEELLTIIVRVGHVYQVRDLCLRLRGRTWTFAKTSRFAGGSTEQRGELTSIRAMLDLFAWLRGGA